MSQLHGLRILVTRPAPQGEILCNNIHAAGGNPTYFPTLTIAPPLNLTQLKDQMTKLADFDWLIFISPQAVLQSVTYLTSLPSTVKIAAVGAGTAHALQATNLRVDCFPAEEWSSAGLLTLPELYDVAGKKIALIKGEGGRETLAQTLTERGANVTNLDVYRRLLPEPHNLPAILDLLRTKKIDVIICTSNAGLQNLNALLQSAWHDLHQVPLLVISASLREKSSQLGFKQVLLAKNASDSVLIDTLVKEKNMSDTLPPSVDQPTRKPSLKRATGLLLFLFVIAGVAYGLYFYNMKTVQRAASLQIQTTELQTNLDALNKQMLSIGEELKSQSDAITALRQTQTGYTRDEWRLVEAEFLTKLANDKVQLENNIPEAIQLLQAADAQLRNLSEAKLLPIRKALAMDIVKLQAAPRVDISGIYLRLAALNEEIIKLPLPNKPDQKAKLELTTTKDLPWWRRGLLQAQQALSQVVTVRHHQTGVLPLILPEQQDFLYQNLHSVLEKAMWGVLHQQQPIYQVSLDQAITWIQKYFVSDAPATVGVLKTLQDLRTINVHPGAPKVTEALQAFQQYFSVDTRLVAPSSSATVNQ